MTIATKSSTLAVGICFPVIDGILTLVRIYTRRRKRIVIAADDWFAVAAWIILTGACVTLIIGIYNGAFFLTDESDPVAAARHEHALAQITGAIPLLWFAATSCIKLSVLFFYRRIFVGRGIYAGMNIITWTLIGLTVTWMVYSTVANILYCGVHVRENFEGPWDDCPVWAGWLQYPMFIGDPVLDFCILIVPIPHLLKLRVATSKKLTVLFIFAVGGMALIAGLLNAIYQGLLQTWPNSTFGVAGVPTTSTTDGFLLTMNWPVLEAGVGLIACNLPSLAPWITDRPPSRGSSRFSEYIRSKNFSWGGRSSVQYQIQGVNPDSTVGDDETGLKAPPLMLIKHHSHDDSEGP